MDRFRRVETLFHAAFALPEAERESFLRAQANGDEALVCEVLRLLDASPAAEANLEAIAGSVSVPSTLAKFGPYKIVRLLGRGGMGAVYLAERADGEYSQLVALKVLSPHLAGEAFSSRFRTERQLLAQMNHPNVVRLLDGGVATTGEPYLVTEFIDGEPLDSYCDRLRLPVHARVRLLLDVCSAVVHAHRNLVIHRDIKPGNILVDKSGIVKLLDFGTAKLIESAGQTDSTTLPLLTPRYASPEQLRNDPLGVASDVYSLGLVCFELLAGHRAFDLPNDIGRELARASDDLPVLHLGSRASQREAELRSASLPELKRTLGGDLAAIAYKAVAYHPSQRYQSVEEFRDDLLAYLDARAVQARPVTFSYRARKFIVRRRFVISAIAAVVVAVLLGFISTLRQRNIAQDRFDEVRRLARYQLFDLYDLAETIPGSLRLRSEMAVQSLAYLDRLSSKSALEPSLAVEIAQGYRRLGDVRGNFAKATLGNPDEAIKLYSKGIAVIAPFGSYPPAAKALLELEASSAIALASSEQTLSAFSSLQRAIDRLDAALRLEPSNDDIALLLARACNTACSIGPAVSAPRTLIDGFESKALEILRPRTALPQFRLALAELYRFRASALVDVKPAEARVAVDYGLRSLNLLAPEIRSAPMGRKATAGLLMVLAAASRAEGDFKRAMSEMDQPLAIVRQLASDPDDLQACANLTLMLENRSLMRWDAEDYPGYLADLTEALPYAERLVKARAGNRFKLIYLSVLRGLAYAHDKLNTPNRDQSVERAAAELRQAAADDLLGHKPKSDLADLLLNLKINGKTHPEEALFHAEAAARLQPSAMNAWESVAEANSQLGRYALALAAIDRALASIDPPKPGEPPTQFHLSLQRKQRQILDAMRASSSRP